jgi:hypothetical protein
MLDVLPTEVGPSIKTAFEVHDIADERICRRSIALLVKIKTGDSCLKFP